MAGTPVMRRAARARHLELDPRDVAPTHAGEPQRMSTHATTPGLPGRPCGYLARPGRGRGGPAPLVRRPDRLDPGLAAPLSSGPGPRRRPGPRPGEHQRHSDQWPADLSGGAAFGG